MRLNYIDKIRHLAEHIQESIIREAPHTRVKGPLPPELAFLGGGISHFVDLGFENLGLAETEKNAVYDAFVGQGVAIPGIPYKLRYTMTGHTVVEPVAAEKLLTLPEYWAEAVLVFDANDKPSFIGKRVRPEQYGARSNELY